MNTSQIEMKIHDVKDKLSSIEAKVERLERLINDLNNQITESQKLFDSLKESV